MKYVPVVITAVALGACQTMAPADKTNTYQSASTIDVSAYPDLTAESDRDKVENYWIKTVSRNPQYPMEVALAEISGCVELVYSINASGRPEGYPFPQGVFEDNVLAALARWRWVPSPANTDKQPVLTSTQLNFVVSESTNIEEAQATCGIHPV